jgi:septal ring factor EnvC (AmiA/AmiB activator)
LSQWSIAQTKQVNDLERKRQALLKEIETTNQLLSENIKTATNAFNRLNLLNRQIATRKQIVETLNQEITAINEGIIKKENEIANLEEKLQKKKLNYIASIQKIYAYKNSGNKFLFIFSAKSINESYQRILYLKKYSQWQKEMSDEISAQQNRVAMEKQSLEKEKTVKLSLINERLKEKERLGEEEKAKKNEIEILTKNEKKLRKELVRKKAEAKALDQQIDKIIAEEIAASKKAAATQNKVERKSENKDGYAMTKEEKKLSSNFSANKGKLPFPLKGKYKIVEYFGINKDINLKGIERYNNGIEIETTEGNEAVSVFDGVVSAIFTKSGYNNAVFVKHGNFFTLYANLETIYVKKGDVVKTGQRLGKIFTDRMENSTLLHFEIRKEREKLNPLSWLDR